METTARTSATVVEDEQSITPNDSLSSVNSSILNDSNLNTVNTLDEFLALDGSVDLEQMLNSSNSLTLLTYPKLGLVENNNSLSVINGNAKNRIKVGDGSVLQEVNVSYNLNAINQCQPEYFVSNNKDQNMRTLSLATQKIKDVKLKRINISNCSLSECTQCKLFSEHKIKYHEAREAYDFDKSLVNCDPELVLLSVDMQKVILLPRLPGFKTCMFTKRLVCFNATFAPLK